MFPNSKRKIIAITKKLRDLEQDLKNLQSLADFQAQLIKRIFETENKKSRYRSIGESLKKEIKTGRLPKSESIKKKRKLDLVKVRIEESIQLLYIWRCFGDGVVFSYLDKWGLKSLTYEEETGTPKRLSGSLGGKEGFPGEVAVMLDAIKNGVPAILCDLTDTVRHGDVCLMGDDDPYVIEVKSSLKISDARADRQARSIEKIHNYLKNDYGENVRGASSMRRMTLGIPEITHQELINNLIAECPLSGYRMKSPEPGISYFVFRNDPELDFPSIMADHKMSALYFLNAAKSNRGWSPYYPFTLSIRDPQHLFEFIAGDIVIMVTLNFEELAISAKNNDFTLQTLEDSDYIFEFESIVKDGGLEKLRMSYNFIFRMVYEFTSWDWIVRDLRGSWTRMAAMGTDTSIRPNTT